MAQRAEGPPIAAHALHAGLTLVSNNTREFKRIPGLQIENWSTP